MAKNMGTKDTAKEKLIYMETNLKKFKEKDILIRNFCKKFGSTPRKAKEILKMLK